MAEQTLAERPKELRFAEKLPGKPQFGERLRLRVAEGQDAGLGFCLLADALTIGRDDSCDLVIQDEKASRRHVELLWKKDKYFARDLDSANGLLINKKKVKGAFVEPGDILTIGNSQIEVIASGRQSELGNLSVPTKAAVVKSAAEEKLRKKRVVVFAVLFFLAMIVFSSSEKVMTFKERAKISFADQEKPEKKLSKKKAKEELKDFVPGAGSDSPGFKSAQRFYRQGMRELQNRNYKRAIAAFETAQTVDPTHELSRVYTEIARKSLEEEITFNYRAALSAVTGHRYRLGRGYYQTVMRLLETDPQNEYYLKSKEAIEKIDKLQEQSK